MAKIKILAARQVETLPAGFHADGANLYLRVRDTGTRSWVFRYKVSGKVVEIGLGPTADRSLLQARELASRMRTELADGRDPGAPVRAKRGGAPKAFRQYALELVESKRAGWRNEKHVKQWGATLEAYANPVIGDKLPADVTLADVLEILKPIWNEKTETASRVRQRVEAVLDYAAVFEMAHGRNNPARWKGCLDKLLPAAKKVSKKSHHAAAAYVDVPAIMAALRAKDHLSAHCLRFNILTAARSGEARGALWSEIDFPARTWTIPAARMKADREHRVPLCDEAVAILKRMAEWRQAGCDRVFPGARGGLLSDVAVNKTLHSIAPDVTVHGFRSSFRQWGAEVTSFPSAALEAALAHVNPNQTEAAYQRSTLFDRRLDLMDAWGRYCAGCPRWQING